MLILSHGINDGPLHYIVESTGEHIEINLLEVKNYSYRVGINAPPNITILRDKPYKRSQLEKGINPGLGGNQ